MQVANVVANVSCGIAADTKCRSPHLQPRVGTSISPSGCHYPTATAELIMATRQERIQAMKDELFRERPCSNPRERVRTVPMQVLNLSFLRTGSMSMFRK